MAGRNPLAKSVQTVGAGALDVFGVGPTMPDNTCWSFRARVEAFSSSGADQAVFDVAQGFVRRGAGPVPIAAITGAPYQSSVGAAGWTVTFVVVGNQIRPSVTAGPGITVSWNVTVDYGRTG